MSHLACSPMEPMMVRLSHNLQPHSNCKADVI